MTKYVYSTHSNNQLYTGYTQGAADLPKIEHQVLIKGGANVADKRGDTVKGVENEVTDEQFEILQKNQDFNLHKENGFITVLDRKRDAEKVASDGMEAKDASAPLTPADYVNSEVKPVVDGQVNESGE